MERHWIDWLQKHVPKSPRVRVGIGDDAAVLTNAPEGDLIVTTDAVTDHVDFRLADTEPRLVGHKALAVNLSDLAAMAAQPVAAVVSLVLPRDGAAGRTALELAKELYHGVLPLASRFDLDIAGGDVNTWEGPLVISITAIGRATARGPLLRSGALPGDALLVTGSLGGSILGRHLNVEPRVAEALALHSRHILHAGIDISDGLALDASRLAAASNCGAALRLDQVPVSPDAERLAATTGRAPLSHALGDGEDFELLLAAPPAAAEAIIHDASIGVPMTRIGEIIEQPGLWQLDDDGALTPLEATGYQH